MDVQLVRTFHFIVGRFDMQLGCIIVWEEMEEQRLRPQWTEYTVASWPVRVSSVCQSGSESVRERKTFS
eukprot:s4061_g4.t2